MAARRKPMSEINVVPYIDVMLVLLVIFMATAPLLTQGVNVDLPKAPSEPIKDTEQDPLVISIRGDGRPVTGGAQRSPSCQASRYLRARRHDRRRNS